MKNRLKVKGTRLKVLFCALLVVSCVLTTGNLSAQVSGPCLSPAGKYVPCVITRELHKIPLCDGCASYCVQNVQTGDIIKCFYDVSEGDELMKQVFEILYENPCMRRR